MKNYCWILLFTILIVSCQKDISGSYKALNPKDSFENEIITIIGDSVTWSLYSNARESYHDKSRGKYSYIYCTFPFTIIYKGTLSKEGEKYTAKLADIRVNIDKKEFKASSWHKHKISNDSLINYYEKTTLELLDKELEPKRKESDNIGFQFVVRDDKLMLVGGNEVNDYYIKLVE